MENGDVSREGITMAKLAQPFRLLHAANNHAIAKFSTFSKLDLTKINNLLKTDFAGVILDVDETLAPHHGAIAERNVEKILEMVADGVKFVIFSNMKADSRYDEILTLSYGKIPLMKGKYPKPDPRGFQECLEVLELPPNRVIAVGDNFITDGGSIQVGIPFVHIEPLPRSPAQNVIRAHQVMPRALVASISDFYDFLTQRQVLRDTDMDNV